MSGLKCGSGAVVSALRTEGAMRRRLLDMGFSPGSPVRALFRSCSGDPVAYLIHDTVIALRREDSQTILIEPL
ncbi:MAG: ferrous iron transport protein A [Butyricicoccus sp.]|nr:ferrous iron transport protein A [Butyricicoccus sp.]